MQDRRALSRLAIVGATLLALLLLAPLRLLPLHIPLNYNEGWNAYFDAIAVGVQPGALYPPPGSLVFNNYPPLSFYLVGAVGRFLTGDMILAGRLVALLSLLACGPLLGLAVVRLNGDRLGGVAAALLLLLYATGFYRRYVGIDDPQWLAHALMLAGLAVLGRGRGWQVVPAALLMLAGGLTKHSLLALPLAVTLWLWWRDRRAAALWLATAATGLGAALLLSLHAYGPAVFADVLHHRRVFLPGQMLRGLSDLALFAQMLALALLPRPRTAATGLAALFAGIAAVTGVIQRGGDGVAYNAHFELMVAACLALGLAVPQVRRPGLLVGIAALPLLCGLPLFLARDATEAMQARAQAALWQPVIAKLATAPGPVACEQLALCYWAGKPFAVDMFNLGQALQQGQSAAPYDALIRRQAFSYVEYLPDSGIHQDLLRRHGHDPLIDPLAASYVRLNMAPPEMALLQPR